MERKEPLFDLDGVINQFKEVTTPRTQEELIGMLLRIVKETSDKNGVLGCQVVGISNSGGGFVFSCQGTKDGKLMEFYVNLSQNQPKSDLKLTRWRNISDDMLLHPQYSDTVRDWKERITNGRSR